MPDKRICEFGKKAVVVRNWIEFIERIYNAVQKIGMLGKGVVRYYNNDYYGSLGITKKRSKYEWQSEFRLFVNETTITDKPLELDIGNISDIADLITDTQSLLDIKYYFNGEYSSIPSSCYERDAIFSKYFIQCKLIWLIDYYEPIGCGEHFRVAQKHFHNDDISSAVRELDTYLSMSLENLNHNICIPYHYDLCNLYLRLAEDYAHLGMELKSRAFIYNCMTHYMRAVQKPYIDSYLNDSITKLEKLWIGNEKLWDDEKCLDHELGFAILLYEVLMKLLDLKSVKLADENSSYNTGSILLVGNSIVNPNSTGASNRAGGILGYAYYGIEDCYNTGDVTVIANGGGDASAGGIAGLGHEVISHCYNTGIIKAKTENGDCNVSGITGLFYQVGGVPKSQLKNNFCAADSIIGESPEPYLATVYKIAWWMDNAELKNNYSLSSTITFLNENSFTDEFENNIDGANGKTADVANFKNKDWLSNTLGFDFNNIWTIEGDNFPIFKSTEPPTKIDNISIPIVSVYPNPANQYLYINSDSLIKKIELYDSIGNLILTETNLNGKIDVSTLDAGLYIIRFHTENKVINQKIIIKH